MILIYTVGMYMFLGVIFGFVFIVMGISKVDPSAEGASILFKVMIFPGCVGIWPVLLKKWMKAK